MAEPVQSSGSGDFPRVGIVCHPRIDIGGPAVMKARRRLEERGFRVWTYCATAEERPGALSNELNGTRLIASIGGDGTLLWTAQQAAAAHIPVLGINAGRLGFLTQVQLGDETKALDRWAAGDFTLQRRALLEARVGDRVFHALNDVVIHKGIEINLIRIEVLVDGHRAGAFDADGVIVSTPTGSTGYALSLGGPIVHPDVRAIVFMPLNPHSLFNRPVVLPEQARITIRLPNASAILTCDGQQNAALDPGAEVQIAAPGLQVDLVQFSGGPNFFELLRRKLRWGLPLTDGAE
jgi:NAD+ kinase